MNILSHNTGLGGPLSTFGGLNPNGTSSGAEQAQLQSMFLLALIQLSSILGTAGAAAGPQGVVNRAPSFGGGNTNGNSLGGFLGASPATGNSALSRSSGGAGGSGQAAVDYARQFNGKDSISLKGKMKHFTAAGGITNNCADFVSSALESQGLVKGHHINVKSFEQELKKQGYRQVPTSQARPGDVWISNSRGHTELVATKGATKLIGSNNGGDSRQEISEHSNRPGSGVIYQKA